MTETQGPLAGMRVLDFTERMQGPHATQMLADMGADVIKVERRQALTSDGRPDDRYGMQGRYGSDPEDSTIYSSGFLANNRNKRSIAIDLKAPAARELMSKLLPRFDVLYENFRPGVMDRLGLGYNECQAVNPSLIYASASGYGTSGPYAGRPGQDVLVEALTGWGAMTASPEDRPSPGGVAVADLLGAMNGAFAVASALVHRERTGEGQHVRVNLFNSALAGLAEWGFHAMNAGVAEPHRPAGHASPYTPPPYGFYKTRDGYLALSSGRQIAQLCKLLEIDDLSVDKRFSSYGARLRNRDEFIRIIEEALQRRTTQEWLDLMIPLDMFAAPVQTLGEAFGDPQALHNGMVVPLETPVGVLRFIGPPWDLSKTPASVRTAPPTHGQHTDEVLQELDITAETRRRLRDQQVI